MDVICCAAIRRIRAALERKVIPMGNLDMMIAAQALAAEAILVTRDRVFQRVQGLKVEDWAVMDLPKKRVCVLPKKARERFPAPRFHGMEL
jgi:ribosomal silencing factor RsfS